MLYQRIKSDYLQARKDNNKVLKALLSTLIGELTTLEKDGNTIDDSLVVKKIKVYLTNIDTCIASTTDERLESLTAEKAYLQALVPAQLSEDEIKVIVKNYSDMKTLMTFMSTTYPGRYDGKLVNRLFSQK